MRAVSQRSIDPTASTADDTAVMLAIILGAPRRSAFFLDAVGSP